MSSNDQSPTFVLDQFGSSRIPDIPNFPKRQQTVELTNNKRESADVKKYGDEKERCCIKAEYVNYLKVMLLNPNGKWKKGPTEKHRVLEAFMLDRDGDLCDKEGKKIVVCEQYHDLFVSVHDQTDHGGRDACIRHFTQDERYSQISSFGITKEMFNEFNRHCPHKKCQARQGLRGARAKTGKPGKSVAKSQTKPKTNRVSKNRPWVAARPVTLRDVVSGSNETRMKGFEGIHTGDTQMNYPNEDERQPLSTSSNTLQLASPPPDVQQPFSTLYNQRGSGQIFPTDVPTTWLGADISDRYPYDVAQGRYF